MSAEQQELGPPLTLTEYAYRSPWNRTLVRNMARVGLAGVFGVATLPIAGSVTFEENPQLVSDECMRSYVATAEQEILAETQGEDTETPTNPSDLPPLPESASPPQGKRASAAYDANVAGLDLTRILEQAHEFEYTQTLELPGGINTHVLTDGEARLDNGAINALIKTVANFKSATTMTVESGDSGEVIEEADMYAHIACFGDNLANGAYKEENLLLIMPSDRHTCMQSIQFVSRLDGGDCNSAGFTLPNPGYFNKDANAHIMVVSSGSREGDTYEESQEKFMEHFVHEFFGHFPYSLSHAPLPITREGIDQYEWWADKTETTITGFIEDNQDIQPIIEFTHTAKGPYMQLHD